MDCTTTGSRRICYSDIFTFLLRTSSKFHLFRKRLSSFFLHAASILPCTGQVTLRNQETSPQPEESLLPALPALLSYSIPFVHLPWKAENLLFNFFFFFPHVGESFLQFQSYSASIFKISIVLIHRETISVQFS